MLKLLVISYAFPPQAEVGALRVAHLCRYLPEYGIKPIVLTAQERFYDSLDSSIPFPHEAKVVRTPVSPTPLDLYKRWFVRGNRYSTHNGNAGSAAARGATSAGGGAVRKSLLILLQTPDPYWGWIFPARPAVDELIEAEKPDAVFSSAPVWASHLVARYAKKKYGLPWLSDYRDPWAHNETVKRMPKWRQWIDLRLEASCIRRSDLIICNTERIREIFREAYPDLAPERFAVLSNGFAEPELDEESACPDISKEKRVLLHTGGLYSTRRVDTFCRAIVKLAELGRINPAEFDLLLLGPVDSAIRTAAEHALPENIRKTFSLFQPPVGWARAQQIMRQADVLLLFQGSFRVQIPAKFFEYLQTGKPILAITEEGALSKLIEETKSGLWADPGDVADIAEKLLGVLKMPTRSPDEVLHTWSGSFSYRVLTGKLAQWIKAAVEKGVQAEAVSRIDVAISRGK